MMVILAIYLFEKFRRGTLVLNIILAYTVLKSIICNHFTDHPVAYVQNGVTELKNIHM